MNVAAFRIWAETRPVDERWELLDGEPVMMTPPFARHQRIVMNLGRRLDELAERRGATRCPASGY